jgi:GNAT superfamily N-acetyltransferase
VIEVSVLRLLLVTSIGWLDRREREALAQLIEENPLAGATTAAAIDLPPVGTTWWPIWRASASCIRFAAMELQICALSRDEAPPASHLLSRAFAADPIITHYLNEPRRRAIAFPAFFQGVLHQLLPSGCVLAARDGERLVGVAAWLPPEPADPDPPDRALAQTCERTVRALFPITSRALYDGFDALEQWHPAVPHWYLAFVGVEPALQRAGIGRALIEPIIRVADETRTACYLETPFPDTYSYYEALGFIRGNDRSAFAGVPQAVATFLRTGRS